MSFKRIAPFIIIILGVLSGILRGASLTYGYEIGTMLPIQGNAFFYALITICVIAVIISFIFSRQYQSIDKFEHVFHNNSTLSKTVSVCVGFGFMVSGVIGVLISIKESSGLSSSMNPAFGASPFSNIPIYILCLLLVLTGVAIISMAKVQDEITENTAMIYLIPIFWSCFEIIITFRDNGTSPVISIYAFEIIATILMMYAFYCFASFLYSDGNVKRYVFASLTSIFTIITVVFGYIVHRFMSGYPMPITGIAIVRYVSLALAAVFITMNLIKFTNHKQRKEEE